MINRYTKAFLLLLACCSLIFSAQKVDSLQAVIKHQQQTIESIKNLNKSKMENPMRLKLFEIELYGNNLEESRKYYEDILGLQCKMNMEGLKVFDPGVNGIDFDFSQHFKQKTSLSFLVKDIYAYRKILISKGLTIEEPKDEHLNMKSIKLEDPNGVQIIICSPTEKSPNWLKSMAE